MSTSTVAIAVFSCTTYWVVLQPRQNMIAFETFGSFSSNLQDKFFKDESTALAMKEQHNNSKQRTVDYKNEFL